MHWTEHDLLNHLYGVGPEDRHLEECRRCRERWLELLEARGRVQTEPVLSGEMLAAQRSAIWERIDHPHRFRLLLPVQTLAAAALIVLGLLLSRPAPPPVISLVPSDAQFFSEIVREVQGSVPWESEGMSSLDAVVAPGQAHFERTSYESRFFADLAAAVESDSPRAAEPMRGLFSEGD